jgi:hypothetical protein
MSIAELTHDLEELNELIKDLRKSKQANLVVSLSILSARATLCLRKNKPKNLDEMGAAVKEALRSGRLENLTATSVKNNPNKELKNQTK